MKFSFSQLTSEFVKKIQNRMVHTYFLGMMFCNGLIATSAFLLYIKLSSVWTISNNHLVTGGIIGGIFLFLLLTVTTNTTFSKISVYHSQHSLSQVILFVTKNLPKYILGLLLFWFITIGNMFLFLLPGIFWLYFQRFFGLEILGKGENAWNAMKNSLSLSRKNWKALLLSDILFFLMSVIYGILSQWYTTHDIQSFTGNILVLVLLVLPTIYTLQISAFTLLVSQWELGKISQIAPASKMFKTFVVLALLGWGIVVGGGLILHQQIKKHGGVAKVDQKISAYWSFFQATHSKNYSQYQEYAGLVEYLTQRQNDLIALPDNTSTPQVNNKEADSKALQSAKRLLEQYPAFEELKNLTQSLSCGESIISSECQEFAQMILKSQPQDAPSLRILGLGMFYDKKYAQSLTYYEQIREKSHNDWLMMADSEFYRDRYQSAINYYNEAIKLMQENNFEGAFDDLIKTSQENIAAAKHNIEYYRQLRELKKMFPNIDFE